MSITISGVTSSGVTFNGLDSGASTDPYFANVALLLHFDASGVGATPIVDSSISNKSVSIVSDAKQGYTTQTKFGKSAFNSSGYFTVAPYSDFAFGTGDFTIEFWLYSVNSTIVAHGRCIFDTRYSAGPGFALKFPNGKLQYVSSGAGTTNGTVTTADSTSFKHVAVVRASGVVKVWLNGTLDLTVADTTNYTGSGGLRIFDSFATGEQFNGYLDDFRVTTGVARYTGNFTPPTAAFPNS